MQISTQKPIVSSEEIRQRKLLEMSQTIRHIKEVAGIKIIIDPNVYAPATDTYLMLNNVRLKEGDRVLDVGTGTGVIAIKAALSGAEYVLGVDLNPRAVINAKANKKHLNAKNIFFSKSDIYEKVSGQFDVIIFNPPYENRAAENDIDICFYDENHTYLNKFFDGLSKYLKPGGTAYIAWSNLSAVDVLPRLSKEYNFKLKKLAEDIGGRGYTFYVYSIKGR